MDSTNQSGTHTTTAATHDWMTRRLAAAALLLVACGGASNTRSSGPAGSEPSALTVLTVRGLTHRSDGSALSGVEVCLERGTSFTAPDPVGCTTSAADGSFAVSGAELNSTATLTFRREGFLPLLRPLTTQAGDIALPAGENALLPASTFLGAAADPTRGQVPFVVKGTTGAASEVSATADVLDVLQGFVPAEAAVYVDPSGSVSEGADGVAGGFINLSPGLYRFHFAGIACSASAAIAGYAPSGPAKSTATLYVDIRAGYVLAPIHATCSTNP